MCLCARFACTPPFPARLCRPGERAWAPVSAAPRHSWLGRWDVCVCLCARSACAPPLPDGACGVWVGRRLAPVPVPWFLVGCARCKGLWHPPTVWLGTCPCALVVAGGVPLWRAWWPRVGGPRLVRSIPSRCSGRLSRRRGAFPHPGALRPRIYGAAARGTWRPAENRALCACPWPLPMQRRWARSASYPFWAPPWGCPWRVPPASVLGCVRCGGLRVWTRSLTRPVSRTVSLSTADSAGALGLFRADANTAPFGWEDATPGSRVCVRVLALLAGLFWPASRARFGAPHLFLGPLLAALFVCSAPSVLGLPCLWLFLRFFFFPLVRSPCPWRSMCAGPGCLGPWRLLVSPLLLFFFLVFLSPPPCGFFCFACFFYFFRCLGFLWAFFCFPSFSFLLCRNVRVVRCWGCMSGTVGRVGRDCCGPCASAGPGVRLRSVVRCLLPVPPPPVLLSVVLRVPGGAMLAVLLFPLLPCGVACPPPSGALRGFFFFCLSGVCWLCAPPPPGWYWCPVSCFVVCRVAWCCGLWCVLCCARFCVAFLCRVGFVRRFVRRGVVLGRVLLFMFCFAFVRCCVLCWFFSFAFFLAFPWCSGLFLFLYSACPLLCWCACVVALCAVLSCPCGAGWCFVLLPFVFACLLLRLAVLCCVLVGPGGSWCRVSVVCCGVSLGAVLRRVAARCAAWRCVVVRCVVLFCSVCCFRALCPVLGHCLSSWGPVPSGAVFCLVSPRCVCFAVVCCCVVLFAAVLCALCLLGCRAMRSLSSPPCAVLLCGPALPWCPAPLCCAPWCCAAVWWCCGVLSCCLVWFVSCVCLVSPT